MPHAKISGWLEADEQPSSTIPKRCPKCKGKRVKVDVTRQCGYYFVYCVSPKCRWCDIYNV